MARFFLLLPVVLLTVGCATSQLAFTTKSQIRTQNDIYIGQVMENLADASDDPTALPHFTLLQNGVPSVGDRGTITFGSLTFPARSLFDNLHRQLGGTLGPVGAERDVGSNWTITPINDPDRLSAMRYLNLWILERPLANVDEAETLIQQYIGPNFHLAKVPQGWFHCGGSHAVPKEAYKRLHRGAQHYWVAPGMEEHLTKVTLTILGIATAQPSPPHTQNITWEIDPSTGTKRITVTRLLPNRASDEATVVPRDPIQLNNLLSSKMARGANPTHKYFTMNDDDSPLMTSAPVTQTSSPFMQHLNNYVSPIVSPGLFSQPR